MSRVFNSFEPNVVIHLAAQAGVRYSIENPEAYVSSNLVGTSNLLEQVKAREIQHFMFASTSSVYGGGLETKCRFANPIQPTTRCPFTPQQKQVEVLSHSYAHLFDIPTTCFRFFTVYGPGADQIWRYLNSLRPFWIQSR